jgi:hypothetical protein
MKIAKVALILVLLSTTICKGEENRDQEVEEDPATENSYFWVGIIVIACKALIAWLVAIWTIQICFWVYDWVQDQSFTGSLSSKSEKLF